MSDKVANLLAQKRFWPLFWTQFLGAFNDNVFKNALVILITYKSYRLAGLGSEQMVALCGGIFILPFFLFSTFAGQVADKFPKHKLMVWIKVWEVAVMVLATAGFFLNNLVLLLVTLFLMGLQSTFFGPAKYSILPELLSEQELVQGNSLVGMGTFVSILLGTITGGVIMGLETGAEIKISSMVLLISCLGVIMAKQINPLPAVNPGLKMDYGIFKPTWQIVKLAKETTGVWNSILGISWFWFLGAALLSIFPVYVKNTLGGNEQVATLFLALFSIGVAMGSILCEKLSNDHLEIGLVPFGAIGISLFIFDLYLIGEQSFGFDFGPAEIMKHAIGVRIMADLFLFSLFSGLFIVPLYTYMQQFSRKEVRSRVVAGNNILNALFMVASSLLLTYLYGKGVTTVQMYLIFSLLNLVVAIYIFYVVPEFLLRFGIMLLGKFVYRTEVKGASNIPSQGAAVLVCNHVSFVDWLVISALIKRPVRFVMHYVFMKIPVLKYFFKAGKVIPIAGFNENRKTLEQSFVLISEELRKGEIVCIFPEGEITKTGELAKFKKGIEKIIGQDPVPVIPMTLKGLWGSFFSRKYGNAASKPMVIFRTFRKKIRLTIGKPVPPEQVSAAKLENITLKMLGHEPRREE